MKYFDVELLEEAKGFVENLSSDARAKIYYCIAVAQVTKDPEIFKKLSGSNIWEFRILYKRTHYRLFSFWDSNRKSFVICTHAIIKKTARTPQKEIDKAEITRINYLNNYGKII